MDPERGEKGRGSFVNRRVESFPNFVKTLNLYIQETKQTPIRINIKKTLEHIKIKFLKSAMKRKILKAVIDLKRKTYYVQSNKVKSDKAFFKIYAGQKKM